MKHLIHAAALLLITSCGTTKKVSTTHTVTTKDSVSKEVVQAKADSTNRKTVIKVEDTAIGVAPVAVADSLPKEQLEPPRNKAGKAQKQRFQKKEKGLTAFVEIDTSGNIKYGATADSQTLFIKGLVSVYDSTYINKSEHKASAVNTSHSADTRIYETWKKVRGWGGWPYVLIVGFCIVVVFAAIWGVNKVSKWPF